MKLSFFFSAFTSLLGICTALALLLVTIEQYNITTPEVNFGRFVMVLMPLIVGVIAAINTTKHYDSK